MKARVLVQNIHKKLSKNVILTNVKESRLLRESKILHNQYKAE